VYVYNCFLQNSVVLPSTCSEVEKKVGLQNNGLGHEYPSISWGQTTECLFSVAASSSADFKITEQCKYLNAGQGEER